MRSSDKLVAMVVVKPDSVHSSGMDHDDYGDHGALPRKSIGGCYLCKITTVAKYTNVPLVHKRLDQSILPSKHDENND
jgi:hypothetical protein